MRSRKLILLCCFLPLQLVAAHAQPGKIILAKYKEYLLKITSPSLQNIDKWVSSIDSNGQWHDIDYANTATAFWETKVHLNRVVTLAWAWNQPTLGYYGQQKLWYCITKALDHWLTKRYQNSNWWHNEIGVPQHMRDILVLTADHLSEVQLKNSLEVLHQFKLKGTGANLTWSADLALHYAAMVNDTSALRHCSDLISQEIHISDGDGIRPDYSFHQHGQRLQIYSYGAAYIQDNIRLAWELDHTPWAIPADKIKILTDAVLLGWQWMARGIFTTPATIDRSVSRRGHLLEADIRSFIPWLAAISPTNKAALDKMLQAQQTHTTAVTGFRQYPYSDFAAWQQPGFSFFLKTISDRTLPSESINGENLLGKLLNAGNTYLIKNGREYTDLLPVWDWQRLPGITTAAFDAAIERKNFAGAAGDNSSGIAAMDYALRNNTQSVSAKKSWACHGAVIVCLLSGLRKENIPGEMYTVLEQSRWQENVKTANATSPVLSKAGQYAFNNTAYIFHAGFGYLPVGSSRIVVTLKDTSGSWRTINSSESDAMIPDKVFLATLSHASTDTAAAYALAGGNENDVRNLSAHPTWKILQNSTSCQAVLFNDNTFMATFFESGFLQTGKKKTLSVSAPCVLMMKGDSIYISDPLHKGQEITLRLNAVTKKVQLPADGSTMTLKMKG